jgi:hypothetical protein
MPRVTKQPVALSTIKHAAKELKKHLPKADLDGDGRLSMREVRSYARNIKDPAVGDALATMTSWALRGDGGPVGRSPTVSLSEVRGCVDAAVVAITAKDADGNRRIEGGELTKANRLQSFKALAQLANAFELGTPK